MEKEIGERFFLNYFILIFIHQTISTYHNKVTKAWCYTSQFWYNRTLGIILILDSCYETWSTTYIRNENPNYGPGQYLSSEQKPLFHHALNIGKQYRLEFISSYMSLKSS